MMDETDKLRVLIPHWIEHSAEHAAEFLTWAERVAAARRALHDAASLIEDANVRLEEVLDQLGGPLEHHHG